MSTSKRSWLATGFIVLGCTMVWMGSAHRDRVDLGGAVGEPSASLSGLRVDASSGSLDIPIPEYFKMLVDKIEAEYVEEIADRQKLASGTIRGMLASLGDARSLYLDKDAYSAYRKQMEGKFEGIGVFLELDLDKPVDTPVIDVPAKTPANPRELTQIPRLVVAGVVPGSPAANAGIQIGDIVDTIDGQWVVNSDELRRFRELARDVAAKKAPESQLLELRKELRPKLEKSMLPLRALEKLAQGTSGAVTVKWRRGAEVTETPLTKGTFTLTSQVAFSSAGVETLRQELEGKSEFTLDLRNNPGLDHAQLAPMLELLLPAGQYGTVKGRGPVPQRTLAVQKGREGLRLTVLVDRSTRGAASQLAAILKENGATVQGEVTLDPYVVQTRELADGSGYTLVVGELTPSARADAALEVQK